MHGIPGDRVLRDGDVLSIDCGAIVDGWHGDAAITVAVGTVTDEALELMDVTENALWHGLAAARLDGRVTDISHAVRELRPRAGASFGIVEEYVGHGIGSAMHQPPSVPNYGRPGKGPRLIEGLALAVEPMVVAGNPSNVLLDDDWTVATRDGSLAAHFEHTFTLTAARRLGPHGRSTGASSASPTSASRTAGTDRRRRRASRRTSRSRGARPRADSVLAAWSPAAVHGRSPSRRSRPATSARSSRVRPLARTRGSASRTTGTWSRSPSTASTPTRSGAWVGRRGRRASTG